MKWVYAVLVVVVLFFAVWFVRYVSTPPPGTHVEEMGREHVPLAEVEKTIYNSNPPTSGKHYEIPAKAGMYDTPQHDGQLIHSLEHGYVVISYNCNVHPTGIRGNFLIPNVYAHEEEGSTSADVSIPAEASGSAVNESDTCKALIKNLSDVASSKKLFKLIVVPRPNLDTTLALTAWTYIDKFDRFDAKRIEKFIDYHRDHGPEQTPD